MRNMIVKSHLAYEVASKIASQAVGTAILCEGQDDVYAYSTVIPVSECPEPLVDILTLTLTNPKPNPNPNPNPNTNLN